MLFRGPTIRVSQLKKLLDLEKARRCPGRTLRLFDAAYTPREPLMMNHDDGVSAYDHIEIHLINHGDFIAERLPGASYFDLDIASFHRRHDLFADESRTAFEEYVQHLGVNERDPVVVYGRGAYGGMLFAARVWYLLKVYGMEHVAVLEGGLEKWKEEGGEIKSGEETSGVRQRMKKFFFGIPYTDVVFIDRQSDWKAAEAREDMVVKFGDLMFEQLEEVNMLDCRPVEEFTGKKPLAFHGHGAPGSRLPGSLNVPLSSVISAHGELKSAEEIRQVLLEAGFDPAKLTYTVSNDCTQASLLGLALEKAGVKWRLFDGGLREVSKHDASLISASGEEKKRQ